MNQTRYGPAVLQTSMRFPYNPFSLMLSSIPTPGMAATVRVIRNPCLMVYAESV